MITQSRFFIHIKAVVFVAFILVLSSCSSTGPRPDLSNSTDPALVGEYFTLVTRFTASMGRPAGYMNFSPDGRHVAMAYSPALGGPEDENGRAYTVQIRNAETGARVFRSSGAGGFRNNETGQVFFIDNSTLLYGTGFLGPNTFIWQDKSPDQVEGSICWTLADFVKKTPRQLVCGEIVPSLPPYTEIGMRGLQVSPDGRRVAMHIVTGLQVKNDLIDSFVAIYDTRSGDLVDFIDLAALLEEKEGFVNQYPQGDIFSNLDFQILNTDATEMLISYSAQRLCVENCRNANVWEYPAFQLRSFVYSNGSLREVDLFDHPCAPKELVNSIFNGRIGASRQYISFKVTSFGRPENCGMFYFSRASDFGFASTFHNKDNEYYLTRKSLILAGGYHLAQFLDGYTGPRFNGPAYQSLVGMNTGQRVLGFVGVDWNFVQGATEDGCRLIVTTQRRLRRKTELAVYDFEGSPSCGSP